ncbi:hypothetical protein HPB47_019289, partial [Ixodes persulcatus]
MGPVSTKQSFDSKGNNAKTVPRSVNHFQETSMSFETDDEGYTTVGPRRRKKPSVGTSKSSKVTIVP